MITVPTTIKYDEILVDRYILRAILLDNLSDDFIKYLFEKCKLEYNDKDIFEAYLNSNDFWMYLGVEESGSLKPFVPYLINKLIGSNRRRTTTMLYKYLYEDTEENDFLEKCKKAIDTLMIKVVRKEDSDSESDLFEQLLIETTFFFNKYDEKCNYIEESLHILISNRVEGYNADKELIVNKKEELWNVLPKSKEYYINTVYYNDWIADIYDVFNEISCNIKKDVWNKKIEDVIDWCVIKFLYWKYNSEDLEEIINRADRFSEEDANMLVRFIQSRMLQMVSSYFEIKHSISNKCLQFSANAEGVTVIDNTEELQALQNENNLLSINNKKLQDEKDNLQAQLNVFLKEEKREENEEIRELKKQVALLENQILEKNAKLKEFESYTKVLKDSSEAILDIIEDYDLDFLKSKRFLFIGGREETNRELEKIFPNAKFVNNENVNIFINDKLSSCSFLPDSMRMLNTRTQFDYIVFFPKFMNHALFYKYKKEGLNRNIPYMLIDFNNIDLILKNIYLELITLEDVEIA